VLYTDGVTEARRDSDLYGEERLLEFLATHDATPYVLADKLFTNVQEFAPASSRTTADSRPARESGAGS